MAQTRRCAIEVLGRVQGVGFRFFTIGLARRLALSGWVRNNAEGGVSIEVQGETSAVALFEAQLREGPPLARVRRLQVIDIPSVNEDPSFEVRY